MPIDLENRESAVNDIVFIVNFGFFGKQDATANVTNDDCDEDEDEHEHDVATVSTSNVYALVVK